MNIKLIENLYNKAKENGTAHLNGRMSYYGGSVGEIEEKYAIEIENDILRMRHWGTVTIEICLLKKQVLKYYGQSVSDRNSLNTIASLLDLNVYFRYLPSTNTFIMEEY